MLARPPPPHPALEHVEDPRQLGPLLMQLVAQGLVLDVESIVLVLYVVDPALNPLLLAGTPDALDPVQDVHVRSPLPGRRTASIPARVEAKRGARRGFHGLRLPIELLPTEDAAARRGFDEFVEGYDAVARGRIPQQRSDVRW